MSCREVVVVVVAGVQTWVVVAVLATQALTAKPAISNVAQLEY